MAEPIATVQQLLEGIRRGRVPRQVRLFAAQGLLPVSREELLRLQLILTTDGDAELASTARASLAQEPVELITRWMSMVELDPLELDILARVRRDEVVWVAVAQQRNVSDDTLRLFAQHGAGVVQDVVITNQTRVLGCLEILDDLRANPAVTPVVLRRVREFEEEFIAKVAAAAQREEEISPPEHGPDLSADVDALYEIGAHLPDEEELPRARPHDEALLETLEGEGEAQEGGSSSIHVRLLTMNTHAKIMVALKGTREERSILINSRNRLVARAVLGSPKLSDGEVEKFAASRSVSDEVIRTIISTPRWLRLYGVIHALAQNPKTPPRTAMEFLPRLAVRDLKALSNNRNVSSAVRAQAQRLLARRR